MFTSDLERRGTCMTSICLCDKIVGLCVWTGFPSVDWKTFITLTPLQSVAPFECDWLYKVSMVLGLQLVYNISFCNCPLICKILENMLIILSRSRTITVTQNWQSLSRLTRWQGRSVQWKNQSIIIKMYLYSRNLPSVTNLLHCRPHYIALYIVDLFGFIITFDQKDRNVFGRNVILFLVMLPSVTFLQPSCHLVASFWPLMSLLGTEMLVFWEVVIPDCDMHHPSRSRLVTSKHSRLHLWNLRCTCS